MTAAPEVFIWSQPDLRKRKRNADEEEVEEQDDEGDRLMQSYAKYTRIELEDSLKQPEGEGLRCHFTPFCSSLPPFKRVVEYEEHYIRYHLLSCSQCNRRLPTAHLLDLHLCEVHDSYFSLLAARKPPMYKCFVDDCSTLSLNPSERIAHLKSVHKYPKKFNFDIVLGQDGMMQKRKGKSRNRQRLVNENHQQEQHVVDEGGTKDINSSTAPAAIAVDDDMDLDRVTKGMEQVSMMPRSVKFGGRGGKSRNAAGSSLEKVRALYESHAPK